MFVYSVRKVLRLRFRPRDNKKPAFQKFPRIESTLSKCFVLVIVLIKTCRRETVKIFNWNIIRSYFHCITTHFRGDGNNSISSLFTQLGKHKGPKN